MTDERTDYEKLLESDDAVSEEELAIIADDLLRRFEEQRRIYAGAHSAMDRLMAYLRNVSMRSQDAYRKAQQRADSETQRQRRLAEGR
jgi:hypothetical protein